MDVSQVYKSVRSFVRNHDHKFTNVFVHDWEADSFSITSSGYIYEVEVKVSRSDFFADFKKPKHHFFKSYKKGFGILNKGASWNMEGWPITSQYPELKRFVIKYTNIGAQTFNYKTAPNKFFFACPDDLIKPEEVPEYAGLLYCYESYPGFKIIKNPPYLHKDPAKPKELLFDKYYWMAMNHKEEVRNLQWQVDDLKKRLANQQVL